ncbi:MAG TPA: bifunctional 4-hydroxy-2-oxoglutarate aldolase/2-dehydro-3-deoxy-phosphogluconate aldolase [Syntrophales bacterium]|nr:bifunctional 4-hydroxy-2-oxoglutarate aldolase/2-dehydro-3-deoxy-phosphogluconate aldolase [Syntrophales bacterium]HPQ45639.1 bifunctional 4-hydroxy-2-oxoglutarate aldolase/2-dehydro-3-deoxy-phosphogluconate aldolase [Syntrophales bacterium]
MWEQFRKVIQHRIIPVVTIGNAEDATPLAEALIAGGLPCAEITFRTSAAPAVIESLTVRGDMLVGAGTVLTIEQAQTAVDAGACFIVAPGLNPKMVDYCMAHAIPVTPGVATPTDIAMALEFGLDIVKFFPAEAFGGLKTLQAISAPYGMMQFIPTGGINEGNVVAYLRHPQVAAVGGSWMVSPSLISGGQFETITQLTKEAVALSKKPDG